MTKRRGMEIISIVHPTMTEMAEEFASAIKANAVAKKLCKEFNFDETIVKAMNETMPDLIEFATACYLERFGEIAEKNNIAPVELAEVFEKTQPVNQCCGEYEKPGDELAEIMTGVLKSLADGLRSMAEQPAPAMAPSKGWPEPSRN